MSKYSIGDNKRTKSHYERPSEISDYERMKRVKIRSTIFSQAAYIGPRNLQKDAIGISIRNTKLCRIEQAKSVITNERSEYCQRQS